MNKSLISRCFLIYTHMLWSGVGKQLWVLMPEFRDFQLCYHYCIHLSVSGMYLVRSHVSKWEEGSPHRQEQLLWRRERIHFHPWAGPFIQTAHKQTFTSTSAEVHGACTNSTPPVVALHAAVQKVWGSTTCWVTGPRERVEYRPYSQILSSQW